MVETADRSANGAERVISAAVQAMADAREIKKAICGQTEVYVLSHDELVRVIKHIYVEVLT